MKYLSSLVAQFMDETIQQRLICTIMVTLKSTTSAERVNAKSILGMTLLVLYEGVSLDLNTIVKKTVTRKLPFLNR